MIAPNYPRKKLEEIQKKKSKKEFYTNKEKFIDNLKQSTNKFTHAAVFGGIRFSISHFLRQDDLFDYFACLRSMIETGIDFSSFDLIKRISDSFINNDYSSYKIILPKIATMSIFSSFLANLIKTPFRNKDEHNSYSFNGYFKDCLYGSVSTIGFNTAKFYSGKFLPSANEMGGDYLKSSARILIGNIGSTLTTFPLLIYDAKVSPKKILNNFLITIPLVLTDNALYVSSNKISKPLQIK